MEKCKVCGNDMVLDDLVTFKGVTTRWYICPHCGSTKIIDINLKTKEINVSDFDYYGDEVE